MVTYHPRKTRASNALTDLIRSVLRLAAHADKTGNNLVADLGLTSARWQTLGELNAASAPYTVSQLARRMALTRQSVQRLIDEMSREGLIAPRANPKHRRVPLIVLTAAGKRVYRKSLDREWRWTNAIAAHFTTRELIEANRVVQSVNQTMESSPPYSA